MAVMRSANIVRYKGYVRSLDDEVKTWTKFISNLENELNNKDGSYFKENYTKGKKACDNIQKVLTALKNIQKDLNSLISTSNDFAAKLTKLEK